MKTLAKAILIILSMMFCVAVGGELGKLGVIGVFCAVVVGTCVGVSMNKLLKSW